MTFYFNKAIYSDVQSWKVLEIDEIKGEATVIEVKKEPQNLEFVPGGFSAVCVNNNSAFIDAPIVEVQGAKPFKVYKRKDGKWYKKCNVGYSLDKRIVDVNDIKLENNEKIEITDFTINVIKLKKNGQPKVCYSYFGELSDKCKYFYDYNF